MSTLKANTISNVAGSKSVPTDTVVDGSAKAWVNFNGMGTIAIRASFNVSSLTDNGVGLYAVNFSSAFVDANYVAVLATEETGTEMHSSDGNVFNQTTSVSKIKCCLSGSSTGYDPDTVNAAYFR